MDKEKAKKLMWHVLSPATIGELKKAIEHMDESIPVFRLEYGNLEGLIEWKRKVTWKQWCKQQKAEGDHA